MSAIKYWLWLSAAAVSPKAKAALIDKYSDAEKAFYAPAGEFETLTGVSKKEAETLEKRDIRCADRILAACARQGIRAVTMQDADYPQRLKNIFAPPVVIYLKGRLHSLDDEAAIAVIGTRKASAYGLKMGRKLAYEIVRGGGVVVSLLTSGVDAAAARGALLAGGSCVGVLGTPHECEAGTLAAEYHRDVERGLPIALPRHYFPHDDPTLPPRNTWRSHAHLLFSNWLNYFVYQATPYDLTSIATVTE